MAFERVSKILKWADDNNKCVIAFNCIDYNTIYSAITSANKMEIPVICMLYPEHVYGYNVINLSGFAATVRELAETVSVPVAAHLDHSDDINFIIKAMHSGFNSVMYDGSALPVIQNMENCKKVVDIAHSLNVDVEAELGYIGLAENIDEQNKAFYTDPDIAQRFIEQTNVDSIAIAIGNAHGDYIKPPQLDFELLRKINNNINTPLVLHGGSGIPHDQLIKSFGMGINKLNVGTEFLNTWKYSMSVHTPKNNLIPIDVSKLVQNDLIEYACNKMKIVL